MYILYIANKNHSSWSLRPWVLMKVLNIPFKEQLETFIDGGSSLEKFKVFSPTGLVPCLVDGGTTVWDSLSICDYLAEDHSQIWPKDKQARAWARSSCAEMHSGFGEIRAVCHMDCKGRHPLTEFSGALQKDIRRLDELWQQGLTSFGGPFLAGDTFTAADAFFAPIAFRAQTYQLTQFSPQSQAWIDQMLALPAMQEWLEAAQAEADVQH